MAVGPARDSQSLRRHWVVRYVVPSLIVALSALWFAQEKSYESAIALISSAAVLGGALLSRGKIVLAFMSGFVLGVILATFVAYRSSSVVLNPGQRVTAEVSAKEQEIGRLRSEIGSLKSRIMELEVMPASTPSTKTSTIESEIGNTGVKIRLVRVQRVGDSLQFQFELVNATPADVPLALFGAGGFWGSYNPSVLYVERKEYRATGVVLGSERNEYLAFKKIPPDVPLEASVSFRGVPEALRTIELLQVNYSDGNLQAQGSVRFRNVVVL